MIRPILALALAASLPAATAPPTIDQLIAASPTARNAFWGIKAFDLTTGRTIYEQNANRFFVPASNAKLFTTAMALTRLGPAFTFQTRVTVDQQVDAAGTVAGSLRLIGGGDPNLSARTIPYKRGPVIGNLLVAYEELADEVVAHGVKRIDGDIVGDDSWYVWQPYAAGWSVDDPLSDDGAPISALTVNDNTFTLTVRPGAAAGDGAGLTLNPPVEYYSIDNRVHTVAAGGERRVHVERIPGSMELQVWGTIPMHDSGQDLLLGIEDPALYSAKALKQLLEHRGVTVTGNAVAHHLYPHELASLTQVPPPAADSGVELAQHTSAPYIEDLRVTDKVSQNLHAEMALRAVARARRGVGSFEAGREEMRAFLGEVGIEGGGYNLVDGSGLSRLDLVTPAAVVKLLQYMYASKERENFISLLPVAATDGTIASRFVDTPLAGRVYAKTGSLSHVSALSGYAHRRNGRWIAFSILVNNYNGPTGDVRGVMDKICALIME